SDLATESPTLRNLARRLLVTAADAPKESPPVGGPLLLDLRVQSLLALGRGDDAAALAGAAPAAARSPALARTRIDALLLAGRTQDACGDASGIAADDGAADATLAETRVLCQFASGDTQGATFGLDLLRDRKPADVGFIAAAETLAGLPPAKGFVASMRDPTSTQFAAMQAAKLPLAPDVAATARPAVVRALAVSPATPGDLRLAAALRAESMGLLDTEALRHLMDSVDITADELATPLASAGGLPAGRALALLLRATAGTADSVTDIVAKAMEIAAKNGSTATAARLLAPVVASVAPQPALSGFAPVAARILLIAGRAQAAAPWLDLAARDPVTVKEAARLWPLARLWGVGDPSPAALAVWRQSVDPRNAVLMLGLLAAAGQPVPDGEMAALLEVPRSAVGIGPALSQMLGASARDKRVGGTVLAALAAMNGPAFDKVDPDTAARVVAALGAVGLGDDARRLAAEIMLANGV
ncbi:MAG: antifreeze protein, partial [Magnetospirillum sp.]|nr:antifreeze protein [Magnetospirillum sp.]